jgi:hypothetical protein
MLFEKRVLRRISEPDTDEVGEWRKLYSEKCLNLYFSPNKIRVKKPRRMR